MLALLEQLRDKLSSSPKDIGPEVAKRSAYNFIYGVCLFCFLREKGLIKVDKSKTRGLSKLKKIKFLLQYLQDHFPDFFCVDLPDYDMDDYTVKFGEELLIETTQRVYELDFDISYQDFWKTQEEFFISSF